jgi:hypothetical protein
MGGWDRRGGGRTRPPPAQLRPHLLASRPCAPAGLPGAAALAGCWAHSRARLACGRFLCAPCVLASRRHAATLACRQWSRRGRARGASSSASTSASLARATPRSSRRRCWPGTSRRRARGAQPQAAAAAPRPHLQVGKVGPRAGCGCRAGLVPSLVVHRAHALVLSWQGAACADAARSGGPGRLRWLLTETRGCRSQARLAALCSCCGARRRPAKRRRRAARPRHPADGGPGPGWLACRIA